jgi:hypothetical protein
VLLRIEAERRIPPASSKEHLFLYRISTHNDCRCRRCYYRCYRITTMALDVQTFVVFMVIAVLVLVNVLLMFILGTR